jgi:hypothetical protein
MAKDDYDVVLYRLLVYLYACMKHKIIYEDASFDEAVRKNVDNDQYFYKIIEMAQDEGFIKNARFLKTWGNDKVPLFEMDEIEITTSGIRYLKENSRMLKVAETLKSTGDTIAKLASIIGIL